MSEPLYCNVGKRTTVLNGRSVWFCPPVRKLGVGFLFRNTFTFPNASFSVWYFFRGKFYLGLMTVNQNLSLDFYAEQDGDNRLIASVALWLLWTWAAISFRQSLAVKRYYLLLLEKGLFHIDDCLWGKYSPYNSHGSVMILVVCLGGLRNFAEDKYVCQVGTDCQQLFIDH